jgi:hypothetical protein
MRRGKAPNIILDEAAARFKAWSQNYEGRPRYLTACGCLVSGSPEKKA